MMEYLKRYVGFALGFLVVAIVGTKLTDSDFWLLAYLTITGFAGIGFWISYKLWPEG